MRIPCPTCGAMHEWDSLVQHDYARKALAAAFALPPALQVHVARYLRLFISDKAPQHALTPDRYATLLQALVADINKGSIEARGRTWSAPLAAWAGAFEAVFTAVADGRRKTPLRDHSYLHGVLVNMADQAEAKGERATEQQRQTRPLNAPVDPLIVPEHSAATRDTPDQRPAVDATQGIPREVPAFFVEAVAKLGMSKAMKRARDESQPAPVADAHPLVGRLAKVVKGKWKGKAGTVERVTDTDVTASGQIVSTVALRIEFPRNGTQVLSFRMEELEL